MKFAALFAPVLSLQSLSGVQTSARAVAKAFLRAMEFKRTLRVCNAYPYPSAMHVFHGEDELTKDEAMTYKTCRDFHIELQPGDDLLFKVGDIDAGTFSVSDLPNNDAVMMLIIYRHDTVSTAVTFESHVYANLLNAQIAVVDTYQGPEKASLRIDERSAKEDKRPAKTEDLRFDSVVALNPGRYELVLLRDGEQVATESLVAVNKESYVVMRTGVKPNEGSSYAQELVVFPHSDPALIGAAFWQSVALALLLLH
jgi:hypothetical protein